MDRFSDVSAPFIPPFCPNPNCKYHHGFHPHWPWKRHGFYARLAPPHRIQRFTCRHCQRAFSAQTFHTSYWLKRPDLLPQLLLKAVGAMANRQIARDLHVAPTTIDRQLARLGRHCLLLHTLLSGQTQPHGDLALDGFESFEHSQFYPFVHHLLVETETSFFWHFTDSPLRRKGRMTAAQKRRRQQLEQHHGRPDPTAVEHDVYHLLQTVLDRTTTLTLRSDDHRAYPRALRRLNAQVHHRITPAQQRRDTDNPLFEINLLDLLIRHSQANHRRQTIAWAKRRQGSAERLAVLLVWRNYMKYRWEKRGRQTPAMLKGLLRRPWQVADVLKQRLCPSRITLPERWHQYYRRTVWTPALPINRRHELKYAD
jgi:transposase-like protein